MNMITFCSDKLEGRRGIAGLPQRFRSGKPWGNRRGTLLAEVGISTVVLMIVMGLTVKVLATIGQERRAASDRQLGALEAGNLMERITAHPFDQVTPELTQNISISDVTRRSLRDCELAVALSGGEKSAAGVQSAKRVMIRLRWKGPGGQWVSPVRLTSWIEPGVSHP
jgi:hypothetical protein